jgi:hypothetical protein
VLSNRIPIGDPARRLDFMGVALTIPKRQRMDPVPLRRSESEQGGGIKATAQKKNRWTIRHGEGEKRELTGKLAVA